MPKGQKQTKRSNSSSKDDQISLELGDIIAVQNASSFSLYFSSKLQENITSLTAEISVTSLQEKANGEYEVGSDEVVKPSLIVTRVALTRKQGLQNVYLMSDKEIKRVENLCLNKKKDVAYTTKVKDESTNITELGQVYINNIQSLSNGERPSRATRKIVNYNESKIAPELKGVLKSDVEPTRKREKKGAKKSSGSSTSKPKQKSQRTLDREAKARLYTLDPNPKAKDIQKNPITSGSDQFELKGTSAFMDNLEFIQAVAKGDKSRLQSLISNKELSNPFQQYSANNSLNALTLAIKLKREDLVHILSQEFQRINDGKSNRQDLPSINISQLTTGQANKFQFGFATRKVALSRGGKEGNNAFVNDQKMRHNNLKIKIKKIIKHQPSIKMVQVLQATFPDTLTRDKFHDNIVHIVRSGNVSLAIEFLKTGLENWGYGFNTLHLNALKSPDVMKQIRKQSIMKKPHTNQGIMPMHIACINPDLGVLKKFYGMLPNGTLADQDQRKLVHYAAVNENEGAMEFLLQKKVEANDADFRGLTPLMIACQFGKTKVVNVLLKHMEKQIKELDPKDEDYQSYKTAFNYIESVGPKGNKPIHYAVKGNHLNIVKLLIDQGATLDHSNTGGKTPLSIACDKGFYDIAKYLLEKGANAFGTDKQMRGPLIRAAINGQIHIVSLLIRHGVNPNVFDSSKNYPLHYAAAYGWSNIVKYLIENGADPNVKNDWSTSAPLLAMLKGHFGIVDYLIKLPQVDANLTDDDGRSLVSQICMSFTDETQKQLEYLVKNCKIKCDIPDNNGMTPLHYLASNNPQTLITNKNIDDDDDEDNNQYNRKFPIARKMIKKKTAKKCPPKKKLTARKSFGGKAPRKNVYRSIKQPTRKALPKKMARKITSSSARLNHYRKANEEEDEENNNNKETKETKLERELVKVNKYFVDAAQLLIKYGADLKQRTLQDETPVKFALQNGNKDFAIWLIQQGCDFKYQNPENNENILHILSENLENYDQKELLSIMIKKDKKTLIEYSKQENYDGHVPFIQYIQQLSSQTINMYGVQLSNSLKRHINRLENVSQIFMKELNQSFNIKWNRKLASQLACPKIKLDLKPSKAMYEQNQYPDNEDPFLTNLTQAQTNLGIIESILQKADEQGISQPQFFDHYTLRQYFGHNCHTQQGQQIQKQYSNMNFAEDNVFHIIAKSRLPQMGQVVKQMIQNGAKDFQGIDEKNLLGETCIHTLIRLGMTEIVELLLDSSVKFDYNIAQPFYKFTPLHLAVFQRQSTDIVSKLINQGKAKVNAQDFQGNTPLHYACHYRDVKAVEVLLKNKADINIQNNHGATPLHIACISYQIEQDHTSKLETLLLNNKADINIKDDRGRQAPFYIFFKFENESGDPIQQLMAFVDLKLKDIQKLEDDYKQTLLHYACKSGSTICALTLINQVKVNVNQKNLFGNTALAVSMLEQKTDLSIFLIQMNAEVKNQIYEIVTDEENVYDDKYLLKEDRIKLSNGLTEPLTPQNISQLKIKEKSPIEYSIEQNQPGMTYLLIQKGFDGIEALIASLKQGNMNNFVSLSQQLDKKYLTQKDNKGRNFYHILAKYCFDFSEAETVLDVLQSNKVDLFALDKEGRNCLHYAARFDNQEFFNQIMHLAVEKLITQEDKRHGMTPLGYILKFKQFEIQDNQDDEEDDDDDDDEDKSQNKNEEDDGLDGQLDFFNDMMSALSIQQQKSLKWNLQYDAQKEFQHLTHYSQSDVVGSYLEDEKGWVRSTLLSYAIKKNLHDKLISKIIKLDPQQVNKADSGTKFTPLMWAVIFNTSILVEKLLQSKADVNALDSKGRNVAYFVIKPFKYGTFASERIINILINNTKVNLKVIDSEGKSLLDHAYETNVKSLISLMQRKGVKNNKPIPEKKKKATSKPPQSVKYDFQKDANLFIQQEKKKQDSQYLLREIEKRDTPAVDTHMDLPNVEIVKDQTTGYYFDASMTKVDVRKSYYGLANFYVIQLVHDKNKQIYIMWTRWGRFGTVGQFQRTPFNNYDDARKEFAKVFKQKSGTKWDEVDDLEFKEKKYKLKTLSGKIISQSTKQGLKQSDRQIDFEQIYQQSLNTKEQKPKSSQELVDFIKPLFKSSNLIKTFDQVQDNVQLGFQDQNDVDRARKILQQIKELCVKSDKARSKADFETFEELQQQMATLSNDYYDLNPKSIDIAYSKLQPILQKYQVNHQLQQLSQTIDLQTAAKLILGSMYMQSKVNPLDYILQSLPFQAEALKSGSQESDYIMNWINASNQNQRYDVCQIIKNSDQSYEKSVFDEIGNHTLLFHGTPSSNVLSILHDGLRVPLQDSDIRNGNSLGQAIYLSDDFSKSFNYTNYYNSSHVYMFVCEVALGNVCNIYNFGNYGHIPNGYNSLRLMCQRGPDFEMMVQTPEGYRIPCNAQIEYPAPELEVQGKKFTVGNKYFNYIMGRKDDNDKDGGENDDEEMNEDEDEIQSDDDEFQAQKVNMINTKRAKKSAPKAAAKKGKNGKKEKKEKKQAKPKEIPNPGLTVFNDFEEEKNLSKQNTVQKEADLQKFETNTIKMLAKSRYNYLEHDTGKLYYHSDTSEYLIQNAEQIRVRYIIQLQSRTPQQEDDDDEY